MLLVLELWFLMLSGLVLFEFEVVNWLTNFVLLIKNMMLSTILVTLVAFVNYFSRLSYGLSRFNLTY